MKSRKIPTSHGTHTTGIYPSNKSSSEGIAYESSLERDCIILLDKNSSVTRIETQSVRITYYDKSGKKHIYTPDILAHYKNRSPRLIEVKPKKVLLHKISEYRDKFYAAKEYADRHGWSFRVVSEFYIRRISPSMFKDSAISTEDKNRSASQIKILRGEKIQHKGKEYKILKILDIENILACSIDGGVTEVLQIHNITATSTKNENAEIKNSLDNVSSEDWCAAERKYQIIKPLLENCNKRTCLVKRVANDAGVSVQSIYNWLSAYEQTGQVLSLLQQKRCDKGLGRLSQEAEIIISDILEKEYLHKQRRSVKSVMQIVNRRFLSAKITPPHINTIRRRIRCISPHKLVARRIGRSESRRLNMSPGTFPGAEEALSVAQMDHSKLDIILVDSVTRQPIGRPWITLIVDIYSRAILGMHVSLDAPGTASAGACIANAVLPKENFLRRYTKVSGTWPCWGKMQKLHMDNAGEFRGKMIRHACLNRNIGLEWRPVKRPEYGGHIERLMGTVMKEIHELPGTTFSAPQEKYGVNPEKTAALTLKEIEEWLTVFIVDVYHRRCHGQTKRSPIAMLEESLLSKDSLPERETDERRVRIDFLPIVNRKVQRQGIVIDGIYYYHQCLEKHFSSTKNELLTLRRDPHDLSHIFLYDNDIGEYISIGYANITRPPINIWELRQAQKVLKEKDIVRANEDEIFNAYGTMRAIQDASKKDTKKARRERERKATGRDKYINLAKPKNKEHPTATNGNNLAEQDNIATEISPFDNVEKLI